MKKIKLKKVFISGPIKDLDKFYDVELELWVQQIKPVNPYRRYVPSTCPESQEVRCPITEKEILFHKRENLKDMLDCDSVIFLDYWSRDTISFVEHQIAVYAGLNILFEGDIMEKCS